MKSIENQIIEKAIAGVLRLGLTTSAAIFQTLYEDKEELEAEVSQLQGQIKVLKEQPFLNPKL